MRKVQNQQKIEYSCKMLPVILLLLFLSNNSFSGNILKTNCIQNNNFEAHNLAEKFSTYIFNITKKYAATKSVVHFVLPTEKDDPRIISVMDTALQQFPKLWTVTTNDSVCCAKIEEWRIPYTNEMIEYRIDVYVIPVYQGKNIKRFEAQMEIMSREDSFNPRALFLLIQVTTEVNRNSSENAKIFSKMWSYHLYNTTLLIMSEHDFTLTLVTAQAFSAENQCQTANVKGLKYYSLPITTETINIDVFHHKMITNFQKCVFWAGTVPYPPYVVGEAFTVDNETQFSDMNGIDIELIQTLSSKINATFKFYQTHTFGMDAWVTVLEDGRIIGFVQDLLEHKIDVTFGGIIPSYVTSHKLEYSSSYKFSTLNLFVSDADILPPWLIFLKVFSVRVWILSGFVFVLVTLVFHLMSFQRLKHIDRSLMELFKLSIGFSSILNPKLFRMRVVFISWAVYSVHWYIVYTTMMFLLLTSPPHDREIVTFKDLKNSGFKVSLNAVYLEVFGHIKIDKTTAAVLDNHIICPHIETCVEDFVKYRNFSVLGTHETLEYLVNWRYSKIHKLPENVLTYSVSFITNKGHPLLEPISSLIRNTLQAGLLSKWERDVGRYYRMRNNAIEHEEKLIILDLKGAFYILFIGYVVSSFVLILEITFDFLKGK